MADHFLSKVSEFVGLSFGVFLFVCLLFVFLNLVT